MSPKRSMGDPLSVLDLHAQLFPASKQTHNLQYKHNVHTMMCVHVCVREIEKAIERRGLSIKTSLLFLWLTLLYIFIWLSKGATMKSPASPSFLWDEKHPLIASFPLSSHLNLTEEAAITRCHPFDSFCHQLAAKSTSPKTTPKTKPFICLLLKACCTCWMAACFSLISISLSVSASLSPSVLL